MNVEYFSTKSVGETISLLLECGEKSKIIAGGTDLLAQIKKREVLPEFLISIEGISELDYIKYDEINGLSIGTLATISSLESSSLIRSNFSILAQAAGTLGTPVIRDRATIGGNLCNAAPSADTAPALMVLGARVNITGGEGERIISIEDFFTGPGQTIVKHGEVLTEIQVPTLLPKSGGTYVKQTRTRGADLAIVGVAALVVMEGNVIKDAKIALGAVAPTPIRAKEAEEILKGKKLGNELLEECSQAASAETRPIDDTRSSADYRRKLAAVLVKRAVRQAVERV